MNNYLNALLRSVIEAVTEFLPVSSTGHLFFFSSFYPFHSLEYAREFDDLFDIFIQTGAILSVVVLYYNKFAGHAVQIAAFIKNRNETEGIEFLFKVLTGILPIMALGFFARDILDVIKSRNDLLLILAGAWIAGGIFILVSEFWFEKKHLNGDGVKVTLEEMERDITIRESVIIGIFQSFALIPGVSRSAATIITARFLGVHKKVAAEYSFFLAVPVLTAAGLYKLYKYREILSSDGIWPLLLFGTIISFVLCLMVIKLFLKYIKTHNFNIFGYYRIILGIAVAFYYYS